MRLGVQKVPVESSAHNEVWYSTKAVMPPRSRLYPLRPLGLGTHEVESLTSYLARLAAAHRIATGVFLAQEVAAKISRYEGNQYQGLSRWFFRVFFNDTGAWNGTGIMASEPVQVLQALANQRDLHFLTLLTWANVLPTRGLLRTNKAWCPLCYDNWDNFGLPIYEPLFWSLSVVTICPLHQQVLLQQCPNCGRSLYPLEWNSRPGYCSRCQQWLGISSTETTSSSDALTTVDWEWQTFVVHSVGEILAAAPKLPRTPARENLATGIDLCIKSATDGNARAFADLICLSNSVPGEWRTAQALPQLGLLLRVCWCLSIPLLDFLMGKVVIHQPLSFRALPPCQQKRKINRRFDCTKVLSCLETALKEEPPQSMRQVAAAIGYDPGDISRFFPDLCHQISARYKQYKQATRKPRV